MPAKGYDLAIVGGGISGCMIAHQAAHEHPGWRIAVFEQARIGQGCSGYAGAIATPAARSSAQRGISDYSRDWYERYRLAAPDAPLAMLPITYIVPAGRVDGLAARLPHGIPLAPAATQPDWFGAPAGQLTLHCGSALHADVPTLCRHLLAASPGVALFEGVRIGAPERAGALWRLQLPDGRTCAAASLVLAKGAWTGQDPHCVALAVRTKKVVAYLIDAPVPDGAAVLYFLEHEAFLLPLAQQRQWLLSVTSEHWDCAPAGEQLGASPADLQLAEALLAEYAAALLPRLRGARVSCDSYSSSRLPEVGLSAAGALVAYGASGSGFRYAPALGHAVLQRLQQLMQLQPAGTQV